MSQLGLVQDISYLGGLGYAHYPLGLSLPIQPTGQQCPCSAILTGP